MKIPNFIARGLLLQEQSQRKLRSRIVVEFDRFALTGASIRMPSPAAARRPLPEGEAIRIPVARLSKLRYARVPLGLRALNSPKRMLPVW